MRRLVTIAALLSVIAFVPLVAQNDRGHVFTANFWKALPGQTAAFNKYEREFSYPFYDEIVKQGAMVSFRFVRVRSGSGEYTHVFIGEFEDWDAVDAPRDAEAACEAAFDMPCSEKRAEIGFEDLNTLRTLVRREIFISLRP